MTHLGNFLSGCTAVRRSAGGTRETSYYTAINNLLDNVGAQLKPKVRCVMQLKNLVSPPVTPTPWCSHRASTKRNASAKGGVGPGMRSPGGLTIEIL